MNFHGKQSDNLVAKGGKSTSIYAYVKLEFKDFGMNIGVLGFGWEFGVLVKFQA